MSFLDVFKVKPNYIKEQVAQILNISPEALESFENIYQAISDEENSHSNNFFKLNSRDVARDTNTECKEIVDRIVNELTTNYKALVDSKSYITKEELNKIDISIRPQLTGTMYVKDLSQDTFDILLFDYNQWLITHDMQWYNLFRQGLDILDLDPLVYEMLSMNPISMGYWFPTLQKAVNNQSFFKVPATKIVKVPLPILQLTRMEYSSLNPTTLAIVDNWCKKVFELDENKTYFIKTGTYSSKFDFRNAKVTTPKEVNEIGQYLLFIHHQALQMAGYHNGPCIYGVSTTNEWVVREYIEDKENLPCIYHGMPLHTEYRVFVDFDEKEILGTYLYWDSDLMKQRFTKGSDADTADMKHDYIIYCKEEERLQNTFNKNKDKVTLNIAKLIFDMDLPGQWSIDIMQNGDDFWIIDMAEAYNSALVDKLPMQLNKPEENWLPIIKEI